MNRVHAWVRVEIVTDDLIHSSWFEAAFSVACPIELVFVLLKKNGMVLLNLNDII